ncbi:MAG: DUF3105 domain-containing protein [Nitriliruptorales bacterium]|nr:DUF3105 domain-containing protein [Nitriliruptorales bacterium]
MRIMPLLLTAALGVSCTPERTAAPPGSGPSAVAAPTGPVTETAPSAPPETEPVAEVGCDPVEKVAIQGEGHLVGDQEPPVPYNSTPPTSGWHVSGDVPIEVAPDSKPLSEPQQVTVLELGGIVVSFRQLPAEELASLSDFLTEHFDGQVALTRYTKLEPGAVVLTGWGVLQRCTGVDEQAIVEFIEEHVKR